MIDKKATAVRVKGSNGIKELLRTKGITTAISGAKTPIEFVLLQIQRDIVDSCDNHEDGWAMVKAIDVVKDTLLLFAVTGQKDLENEAAEAKKFTNQ